MTSGKAAALSTVGHTVAGISAGIGGQLIWGFFPVYWKLLAAVPAFEVLLHRIVWSFALLIVVVWLRGLQDRLKQALRSRRMMAVLAATTLLISANWLVFIWAANSGKVLEISLGFFINPTFNVLLGMVFLRERLRRQQALAVLLAAAGVVNLSIASGGAPWIALVLAATTALYGLLRKANPIDPVLGLAIETGMLTPLALAYLLGLHWWGLGAFGQQAGLSVSLLLVMAGAVTAVPLLLFVFAAHRLRYITMGLLQYISPTMHFLLAVLLYGETLTTAHMATFACIWGGVLLYLADSYRLSRVPVAA